MRQNSEKATADPARLLLGEKLTNKSSGVTSKHRPPRQRSRFTRASAPGHQHQRDINRLAAATAHDERSCTSSLVVTARKGSKSERTPSCRYKLSLRFVDSGRREKKSALDLGRTRSRSSEAPTQIQTQSPINTTAHQKMAMPGRQRYFGQFS